MNSDDYRRLADEEQGVAALMSATEQRRDLLSRAEHWRRMAEWVSVREQYAIVSDRFRSRAAECREEASRSTGQRRKLWERFAAAWDQLAADQGRGAGIWDSLPMPELRTR